MLAVYQDSFAEDLLSESEAPEVARRLGGQLCKNRCCSAEPPE